MRYKEWETSHVNTEVMDRLFKKAKSQKTFVKTSRHAAAVVYKDKIICIGENKNKTHPFMVKHGPKNHKKTQLHAEMDCLIKTINKFGVEILSECVMYSLRVTNTDKIASAKPCPVCMDAIRIFKLKNVYWTS